MKPTRTMRRITAWIASFAILLAALAPSISHAVAAAKNVPNGWTEICTVTGAKLVQLDDTPSQHAPSHKMSHFEHCPFCLSHAVNLGMPPDAAIAIPLLEGTHIVPPLFYHAPRPLFGRRHSLALLPSSPDRYACWCALSNAASQGMKDVRCNADRRLQAPRS